MVQKRDQTHSRCKLFELYFDYIFDIFDIIFDIYIDIYLFIEYLLTRSQEPPLLVSILSLLTQSAAFHSI